MWCPVVVLALMVPTLFSAADAASISMTMTLESKLPTMTHPVTMLHMVWLIVVPYVLDYFFFDQF